MTLIVGFKFANSVYITGDSAITTESSSPMEPDPGIAIIPQSSFLENIVDGPTKKIRDKMLKTMRINDRIIAGIAGNAFSALDVLCEFKSLMEEVDLYRVDTIMTVLEKAVHTCLRNDGLLTVQIAVGFISHDGPHLISYNYENSRKVQEHLVFVLLGSYQRDDEVQLLSFLGAFHIHNRIAPIKMDELSFYGCINAVLQSFALSEDAFKSKGIGGAFFGLYVTAEGVRRFGDLLYVFVDQDKLSGWVAVREENNFGIVSTHRESGANLVHKFFADGVHYDGRESDVLETLKAIAPPKTVDTFNYIVFLSLQHQSVIVLKRKPNTPSSFCLFKMTEEGPEFLLRMPFDFYFRNDDHKHLWFVNDQIFEDGPTKNLADWHRRVPIKLFQAGEE